MEASVKGVESHGEKASCRVPSFEQPPGKENLWRAASRGVLVLASVVFDIIGKWRFRLSLMITNLSIAS